MMRLPWHRSRGRGSLACFGRWRRRLAGRAGLEIGGPSDLFGRGGLLPVYAVAGSVDNCNFSARTMWDQHEGRDGTFVFDQGRPPGRAYVAEATDLGAIADARYDFVLASHVIEHVANPILALTEWTRVLRAPGLLVLVVPHKDGTFDHRRPVTTFEHLVADFERGTGEDDRTHLDEILELHDLARDPGAGDRASFERRSLRNAENRGLHHHVFDTRLVTRLVGHVGLRSVAVELVEPCHIVVIAQKPRPWVQALRARFGPWRAPSWSSPFPSDA